EVKTSDAQHQNEFADELAQRKAEQIAALDAVEQARLALYNAQKAYDKASVAYEKFGADKAKEISQRRLPPAGISAKITVITQDGRILDKPDLKRLRIDFLPDDPSFEFSVGWDCLGNYKSPAHVETVITKLKAAVGRGDKEFTFPTVEDLREEEKRQLKLDECKTKLRRLEHYRTMLTKAEFDAMEKKLVTELAQATETKKPSTAEQYGKEVA
ncbi:MAG: hypothetical protein II857_04110, partial [Selenomonadaceae bacterium]|nr:hypothetical protein [Selenomonadaceae bacterium]